MATLTVETGTGTDPLANTYADLAFVDSYHLDRNNTNWIDEVDDNVKTASILRAMDWLSRQPWRGIRLLTTQPLSWPRDAVYDDHGILISGIPIQVKNAVAEAALIAYNGTLPGDRVIDQGSAYESIAAGSVRIVYNTKGASLQASAPKLQQILYGLLWGNSIVEIVRA